MRSENIALTSVRGFTALWVVAMHFLVGMADVGYSHPYRGAEQPSAVAAIPRGTPWKPPRRA
jgi:peptidoglycan/LPS O-acetylase OafA/YrhL